MCMTGLGIDLTRRHADKRAPEILNIIGHSYAGEVTHDVSHYFSSATPEQRFAHHMNTSTVLTDPTLEQIMISDHPPFAKRDTELEVAGAEASSDLLKPGTDNENGFLAFARTVSLVLARPFKRSIGATIGATIGASLSHSSLKGLRYYSSAKAFVLQLTHARTDIPQH
ncbi:MAG: hypothetical protein Q9195_000910 [Heterodermia aff. obscurata]